GSPALHVSLLQPYVLLYSIITKPQATTHLPYTTLFRSIISYRISEIIFTDSDCRYVGFPIVIFLDSICDIFLPSLVIPPRYAYASDYTRITTNSTLRRLSGGPAGLSLRNPITSFIIPEYGLHGCFAS